MKKPTFTLTATEAAYVVAALQIALERIGPHRPVRDQVIMEALRDRLAAPLDLSEEVRARLDRGEQP